MAFLYRLLPPRPTFAQDTSAAEAEVMERHIAYWQDLLGRGTALAALQLLRPSTHDRGLPAVHGHPPTAYVAMKLPDGGGVIGD